MFSKKCNKTLVFFIIIFHLLYFHIFKTLNFIHIFQSFSFFVLFVLQTKICIIHVLSLCENKKLKQKTFGVFKILFNCDKHDLLFA